MSGTFDEAVDQGWARFEQRLQDTLQRLGEDSEVVELAVDAEDGAVPYVQFAGSGDAIRCEVSSNEFLSPEHQLDDVAHAALVALGWQEPEGEERPNWWVDVERDETAVAVSMMVGALRQVLGVVGPEFLTHDLPGQTLPPRPRRAARAESDDEDEFVIGWPETVDELRDMVERALSRTELDWERDDDGDFCVDDGDVSVWLSVSEVVPLVRIWTVALVQVERPEQALIEVNILNRRSVWTKYYLEDDRIVVETEVPGTPLVASHIEERVQHALRAIGATRPDLAERVGGFWINRPSDQGVG